MIVREVRMLTEEIRQLLKRHPGATQCGLATALGVSQRTVNARLQQMRRCGEVKTAKSGYGTARYVLVQR